ncbi:hypothetical protein Tco_0794948 [Tanacetum coccineum]
MVISGCGNEAKIKTSWTGRNSGGRFFCCLMEVTNCGFVRCVDPPISERAVDVILGLLRARNELEDDLEDQILMLRDKEQLVKKLWKYMVVVA